MLARRWFARVRLPGQDYNPTITGYGTDAMISRRRLLACRKLLLFCRCFLLYPFPSLSSASLRFTWLTRLVAQRSGRFGRLEVGYRWKMVVLWCGVLPVSADFCAACFVLFVLVWGIGRAFVEHLLWGSRCVCLIFVLFLVGSAAAGPPERFKVPPAACGERGMAWGLAQQCLLACLSSDHLASE